MKQISLIAPNCDMIVDLEEPSTVGGIITSHIQGGYMLRRLPHVYTVDGNPAMWSTPVTEENGEIKVEPINQTSKLRSVLIVPEPQERE